MNMKNKKSIIAALLAVILIICAVIVVIVMRQQTAGSDEYVSLGEYKTSEGHFKYFITKGYDAAYARTGISDATMFDQKIDGVSVDKWITDWAVKEAKRYLLVNKLFDELGLELTDEDKQAVNDRFDEEWYYTGRLAVFGPMGIVEETYGDILTAEKKLEKLTEHFASEIRAELTEEQILARFTENYASAEYIAINYVNGDNESTLDRFNGYRERIEGGESFDTLLDEILSEDDMFVKTSVNPETGKRDIVFPRTGSLFPRAFVKELFEAENGDMIYFDDTANMIYVVARKTDLTADPANLDEYREEVVDGLVSELYIERLDDEAAAYKFSINKKNTGGVDIRGLYGM